MMLLSLLLALLLLPGQEKHIGLPEAVGEKQVYKVRLQYGVVKTKMAVATITLENAQWEGKPVYYSHFQVKAVNLLRFRMKEEYNVDLYLNSQDMSTLHYEWPFLLKGNQCRTEFTFSEADHLIHAYYHYAPSAPYTQDWPLDGHTMDICSLAFFVRSLECPVPGEQIPMNLLMGRDEVRANLEFIGMDDGLIPEQNSFHYVVHMIDRGLLENHEGDEVHVWIGDSASRPLLGLRVSLWKYTVQATLLQSR